MIDAFSPVARGSPRIASSAAQLWPRWGQNLVFAAPDGCQLVTALQPAKGRGGLDDKPSGSAAAADHLQLQYCVYVQYPLRLCRPPCIHSLNPSLGNHHNTAAVPASAILGVRLFRFLQSRLAAWPPRPPRQLHFECGFGGHIPKRATTRYASSVITASFHVLSCGVHSSVRLARLAHCSKVRSTRRSARSTDLWAFKSAGTFLPDSMGFAVGTRPRTNISVLGK